MPATEEGQDQPRNGQEPSILHPISCTYIEIQLLLDITRNLIPKGFGQWKISGESFTPTKYMIHFVQRLARADFDEALQLIKCPSLRRKNLSAPALYPLHNFKGPCTLAPNTLGQARTRVHPVVMDQQYRCAPKFSLAEGELLDHFVVGFLPIGKLRGKFFNRSLRSAV